MVAASRATARTWFGLAILLLPALLTAMDISVLFVAAPEITEALRPTAEQWLWAMDIYGFVIAGLLITMGSLGDRIGRKRLLLAGAVLFGAASLLLAYAPTAELLIAGRALLAIGGATLAPSTLSLIRGMFAADDQRRIAIGAWTAAFSGGAVAGPIIGGLLLEHFWWGSVFLINVPVMILLVTAGPVLIAESRGAEHTRFDLAGAALSLVGVLGLVFALKHTAGHGLDATGAVAALAGVAGLAAFVVRQRRIPHALVDVALFRLPAFSVAIGANTVVSMATVGLGALAFTFLQAVHGLSALQSALWALPTFAGSLTGAGVAAWLGARVRPAAVLAAGLLAAAAGFAVVAFGSPETTVVAFIGGYTVLSLGVGVTATVANSLVLGTAPAERAGAASGISETSTEFGGALGIAVFGAISSAVYGAGMAGVADADPAATETVTAALAVAARAAEPLATTLRDTALAAYTDGVTMAALAGMVLTAVAAALTLHARRTVDRTAPAGSPPGQHRAPEAGSR